MNLAQILNHFYEEEAQLIQVKYASLRIKEIPENDLILHSKGLLIRISVITGWKLPDHDALYGVLKEQFYKKLTESYSECNVDEIEYAFRNFGTVVKDWGKNVNLSLVDEVMFAYLKFKKEISEREERLRQDKQIQYKPSQETLLNMSRSYIEDRYQTYLKVGLNVDLLSTDAINTLNLDGFCSNDLSFDFLEASFNKYKSKYENEISKALLSGNGRAAREYKALSEGLTLESSVVVVLSKKMALLHVFEQAKLQGILNFYIQE